jgi:hypothetical protein
MSGGTHEEAPTEPPRGKLPLKERLSVLFGEYGRIAFITYLTLSVLAIVGFSIAVGLGYQPTTSTGVIGVIITGWVLAKATLPIRILITLGITPMIAHVVNRRGRKSAAGSDDVSPRVDDSSDSAHPDPSSPHE